MSSARLTFLYPHIFRSLKPACEHPSSSRLFNSTAAKTARQPQRQWSRSQSTHVERYGPAAGTSPPPPELPKDKDPGGAVTEAAEQADGGTKKPATKARKNGRGKEPAVKEGKRDATATAVEDAPAKDSSSNDKDGKIEAQGLEKDDVELQATPAQAIDAAESHPSELPDAPPTSSTEASPLAPLEKVLHMPAPTSLENHHAKPPHLQAPPYVHHFDTYTLVKDLGQGHFSQEQSITIMKAMRGLLAENLELAKQALVSKSDVENESYLFRAACSELRTEIQNSRQSAGDKMRSERAHLQHELDVLAQRVTQESLTLKDELKGMFDDRRMGVRTEQRLMDNTIQQLNYQITLSLNSDARREAEGLRWFLTRRAALFIVSMAFLILGSLRYSTYMSHLNEQERKKMAELHAAASNSSGTSMHFTTPSREMGTQTGTSTDEALAADPSLVSLG